MKQMMMGIAAALIGCGAAGETLFDFETEEEAPNIQAKSYYIGVTNRFATSGEHALAFHCDPWRTGLPQWPSFNLHPSVTDWSGYDRMVIDLINLGEGGDYLGTYIAEKEGRIQNGLHASAILPERGYFQWVVPLKNWPQTANPKAVARLHLYASEPKSFDLYIDRITLMKPGEPLPVPDSPSVGRDLLPLMTETVRAMQARDAERSAAETHAESYWRFREACGIAGQETDKMLVGTASTMVKIRPRAAFTATPVKQVIKVRLARNEREGFQLLVAPGDKDLKDVSVTATDLCRADGTVFPASRITCAVTGYVNVTGKPPYRVGYAAPTNSPAGYFRKTRRPESGWWPDPILDHMTRTDISGRDVQSFWIRVHCPENQPNGLYTGALTVSAKDIPPVTCAFEVKVNAFAVPKKSPLPLAITFWPEVNAQPGSPWAEESGKHRSDPEMPLNAWKPNRLAWGDFLADYYITMDSLYGQTRHQWDVLSRLKEQGRLGVFNLGYWSYFGNGENAEESWRQNQLPQLKKNWEKAKELGLADHAYLYGCDEIAKEYFPNIRKAVEILKREFPGVPIFTTAYDHDFGVGTELGCMDWFTPLTPKFNPEKAAAARKEGRQVWWYICCGPHSPYANMFIENAAIEGRILMGAQTVRMRPDGFLYYEISIWNMLKPLSQGPFTDWNPRSWTTYHGDGSWTCMGPGGMPLATQRLENFRDGLEDYAYALELERRLAACKDPDGDWAKRARALLAVPQDVMVSMTDYTDDPDAVMRWRDAMADLIERAEP